MGTFASSTLCTHVPLLQTFDETVRREFMKLRPTSPSAGLEAMYREKVEPLDFDTFLVVDTHWFSTIQYVVNAHERLAGVYTSEEVPELLHEYAYDYHGNPELAELIADEANNRSGGRSRCLASRHPGLPMHYATFPDLTGTPTELRALVAPRNVQVLELKPGETAT